MSDAHHDETAACLAPQRIEADFPLLAGKGTVYLDNAATSLTPRPVVDAMANFHLAVCANIHRGKHGLSAQSSSDYEDARGTVATWLGCMSSEVVFTSNTTAALNLVAEGLELARDDTVLATADAHHSNLLPWMRTARLRLARVSDDGTVDLDHYAEELRRRPRVVALTACSNVTGAYAPIARMTAMAQGVGALVVLDAAQWVPHRRLCLRTLGVDFAALSAHKMLGPTGIGVLCGRTPALELLRARDVGGGMADRVDTSGFQPRKIPHRFEAGTPNIAGVYGLAAALRYLDTIGWERIAAHDRALAGLMAREAARRPHLRLIGSPTVDRAALVSLQLPGVDDLDLATSILSDSYGVMCRHGHLCAQPLVDALGGGPVLRASAYLYNTREDIQLFFAAVDEVTEALASPHRRASGR